MNGENHSEDLVESTEDEVRPPAAKRARILSDSENSEVTSPVKSSNGYGFAGLPSPDVVQQR